jgi:uncharacterized protein YijF (DUF1287 family)
VLKKIITIAPLSILALSITACSHHKPQKVGSTKKIIVKKQSVVQTPSKQVSPKKNYSVRTAIFKPRRKAQRRHYRPVKRTVSHRRNYKNHRSHRSSYRNNRSYKRSVNNNNSAFAKKLSNAALGRLRSRVRYDGSYVKIGYPWGDVPANMGVCTDVVIRSYRKLGIDLQQQVHRDMSRSFNAYPRIAKWKLSHPDTNIDHRRVYNLRAFFARQGAALPVTRNPSDYRPGDLVTWMVGPGLPHIGIVVDKPSKADPRRKMIVHNIANGPEMEDILFRFPISGHYRYTPAHMKRIPKTDRMWVSKSRQNRLNRKNYAQLVNDAAHIMRLHGNKPQNKLASQSRQPVSIANAAKLLDRKQANITLAQAKLGGLTNAQLSNLLKK